MPGFLWRCFLWYGPVGTENLRVKVGGIEFIINFSKYISRWFEGVGLSQWIFVPTCGRVRPRYPSGLSGERWPRFPPRTPAESCVAALHTKPVTCWFILECMPCGVTEFWGCKRRICVTGWHMRFHRVPLCCRNSDTKLNLNGNQRFPSPPCLVPNVSVKAGCCSPKSWNPPKLKLMNEIICENTFLKYKHVNLPWCSLSYCTVW